MLQLLQLLQLSTNSMPTSVWYYAGIRVDDHITCCMAYFASFFTCKIIAHINVWHVVEPGMEQSCTLNTGVDFVCAPNKRAVSVVDRECDGLASP
jgi:hypothetical protein